MNIPQTTNRLRPVAPRTISVPLRGDRYFRGRSSAREPIVNFTHVFDKCQWSVRRNFCGCIECGDGVGKTKKRCCQETLHVLFLGLALCELLYPGVGSPRQSMCPPPLEVSAFPVRRSKCLLT
nr:MAG TPA: hypothetical protein [Caudoviricetes sp.]